MKPSVKGKIILVDDEKYEKTFLETALNTNNRHIKIEYISNVEDALIHLRENADEIFLIISDMDMPKINGLEFKQLIEDDEYLKQKSIPFIFASNAIDRERIIEAYKLGVQGYFQKPINPEDQAKLLEKIVLYWIDCLHPGKEDLSLKEGKEVREKSKAEK
jgi:DNA-binding NtrC family response regulator